MWAKLAMAARFCKRFTSASEIMWNDMLSEAYQTLLRLFLTVMLLAIAGEASFGQSLEVQDVQPAGQTQSLSGQPSAVEFPQKPLHPAKVVIQLLVVGGLMVFWTFRPDPLRQMLQIGSRQKCATAMLQDQISVRFCPEYFTVAHPRIEAITDSTLLGITWGFLGAWWGGALIGAAAGFSARLGHWPKLNPQELLHPIAWLLVFQVVVTSAAGWFATYEVAEPGFMIIEPLASLIPEERHHACFIVSRMHQGTYLSAIVGGLFVCGWIVRCRFLLAAMQPDPKQTQIAIC